MYESEVFTNKLKFVMDIDQDQVMELCKQQAADEGYYTATYPYFGGRMSASFEMARNLLKEVYERCRQAESRVRCLEWAIETRGVHKHIADRGDAMLIYDVADMVKESGLSDDQLFKILFDGLTDEQIEQKRLVVVEQV